MSVLPEYASTGNDVRVFTTENVGRACDNLLYNDEKVNAFKPILRDIATDNGYRSLVDVNDQLIEGLKDLAQRFPNFSEVVEHYISEFQSWYVMSNPPVPIQSFCSTRSRNHHPMVASRLSPYCCNS